MAAALALGGLAWWGTTRNAERAQIEQPVATDPTAQTAPAELAMAPAQTPPAPRPEPVAARLPFEPEMVRIPAGTFLMGSPASETGRDEDEDDTAGAGGRQVRVSVAAFEIGRTEVTFAQWDACVAAGGCGGHRPADQGWGRGDRPVINVSWENAKAYADWLSGATGKRYRLPTEAEWEYAARAGSTGRFFFGEDEAALCRYANGADASTTFSWKNGACSDRSGEKTMPVATYEPNAFGLYDVHGNVWEWVDDCYANSYAENAKKDCSYRVFRGGSWNYRPQFLRSAYRGRFTPTNRSNFLGFRVARTP